MPPNGAIPPYPPPSATSDSFPHSQPNMTQPIPNEQSPRPTPSSYPSSMHQLQQPNVPPYGGAGYMYQPQYFPQPPHPSTSYPNRQQFTNGNANGNPNYRYNSGAPADYQPFPPQGYYPIQQMGGPGPGTMQNGYGVYQPDYPPFPPRYPNSFPAPPPSETTPQPNPPHTYRDGDANNVAPINPDVPPYSHQHPPPPIPPPNDYSANGPIPGGGYPGNAYYFPPGHPYSHGGGFGYGAPQQAMYAPYPGYEQLPPPHQQQSLPPQPQHAPTSAPHTREASGTTSTSSSSSKLNPAAAGFTFTPASQKVKDPATNGEKKEDEGPVFASLAKPTSIPPQPIPNGNMPAEPKKWVAPAIVNGEKYKGMPGNTADEEDSRGSLGLSQMSHPKEALVNGTPSHSTTTNGHTETASVAIESGADTLDTSSINLTQSTSTPAMSSSPTTAATPVSVRTPRAYTDGEASVLLSPKADASATDAALKFMGSPISGYTSPSPSAAMQSFSLLKSPSAKSKKGQAQSQSAKTVDVEPFVLVNARPEVDQARGVLYRVKLLARIPKTYRTERIEVNVATTAKSARIDKPRRRGAKVAIGVDREIFPTTHMTIRSFGEISELSALKPKPVTRQAPVEPAVPAVPDSKDTPAEPTPTQPPAPKAKPSSWAALLKPASASTSTPATPPVAFSSLAEAGPSRLPATPPTEPVTPKSTASALPPPSTGAPSSAAPRPAFNYAAAASVGAALSPQEELARILSEGVAALGKGKGKEPMTVPRGLINTGNMCFANTVLQVLVYCPPFTELFEELGKRLKADLARKTPLLEAMIIFLREFVAQNGAGSFPSVSASGTSTPRSDAGKARDSRREAFVPENVYDAMKENKRFDSMRRGHQEDAEEYLGFFLNTLHEELLYLLSRTASSKPANGKATPNGDAHDAQTIQRPVSPGADNDGDGWLEVGKKQKTNVVRNTETRESAITRLFGGTIRSVLTTPGMKNSVTLEPYQPLQLDIQSNEVISITDALRQLTAQEIVPGVWSASRKANVDATKQITIETCPQVLMLHLKRFVYDPQMDVVKKSKPVAYGTELIIPQDIISAGRRTPSPVKYRLFGVIYHHGNSAGGGHYTVAVSRSDSSSTKGAGGWLHFDDETVSTIPTEDVVVSVQEARDAQEKGGMGGGGLLVGGRERCAYLLFYQRVKA